MFIYIWRANNVPFYVGLTRNLRRTNPRNNGGRNWLCKQRLVEVGVENVHVEIQRIDSVDAARAKEQELILLYGRIDLGSGTLTNLRSGGEGMHTPSAEHRAKLRDAMLRPDHPIYSAEAREKIKKRMLEPDMQARFRGDANPARQPEVRAKLKAVWADPAFREKQAIARTGIQKNFSESAKAQLRANLSVNPAMKGWGERNGKDTDFDAKRIAGIKAAQPKRLEKMADPIALALRKERLRATLNSPEYRARRAAQNTPEYRAKLSEAKRKYWEKKRLLGTVAP